MLTPKQQRFVQEYLVDLNATAAYQRAGYKARGNAAEAAASRLLRNVNVQEAIASAQASRSDRLQVTADRVVKEIARLAFADPRKLFKPDGNLKPITELDDDEAATIASVEVFEEYAGRGESRECVGFVRKLKHWDKNSALDKLCRNLGLYKNTLEVTGKDGGPLRHQADTKVEHSLADELLPYADVIAKLTAGSLGVPPAGPVPPDHLAEPVDTPEAAPEAGGVPPEPLP